MKALKDRIDYLEWLFSTADHTEMPENISLVSSDMEELEKEGNTFLTKQAVMMFFHRKLTQSGILVPQPAQPGQPGIKL